MRKGSVGECAGLLTLLRYMILLAGRSPSQHARPSPFAHRKKEISRRRKKTTCALRVMGAMVASENCHVGPCYVMEALFGNKLCLPEQWREHEGPAQAASRDGEDF